MSGLFCTGAESTEAVVSPAGFTPPGILHSREDLNRIHDMVQAGYQPWVRGFETLRSVPQSSLSYVVQGRAGDRKSKPVAILEIPKGAEGKSWRTLSCPFPASESKIKGHQMLFLTFAGEGQTLRFSHFQLDPPKN